MTQAQYDKQNREINSIKENLKSTMITPEEALDTLIGRLHFGQEKAIKLVDEWGKGKFVPYSVWSKIKVSF